jgi:hypothetical protein
VITRGAGCDRGRGKGRSLRPEFGYSQQQRTDDVSEVEDGIKVAAVVDGTEPSPSGDPVLETLEERERYYQDVSLTTVITRVDPRRNTATARNESSSLGS